VGGPTTHRPARAERLTAARRARSLAGKLSIIRDKALRARFEGAKSADEVDALAREFVGAIEDGTCAALRSAAARAAQYHVTTAHVHSRT
jgi:hypothetical protein